MSTVLKRVPAGNARGEVRRRTAGGPMPADTRGRRTRTRPAAVVGHDGAGRRPRRASAPAQRASCTPADDDATVLQRTGMRGIRLQLDYWKAEERLQNERIGHAVVIYGSTRIVAPAVANARLNEANRLLAARPHDAGRRRAVAAASRLVEHSVYY
ncbi:MAG: TIGR00730 family Rossman fold protein, partial [Burkholderia contaminans]